MACVLAIALTIMLNGWRIAVMVSDFLLGQLSDICFLLLLIVILWLLTRGGLLGVLKQAPAGKCKLNPFD